MRGCIKNVIMAFDAPSKNGMMMIFAYYLTN